MNGNSEDLAQYPVSLWYSMNDFEHDAFSQIGLNVCVVEHYAAKAVEMRFCSVHLIPHVWKGGIKLYSYWCVPLLKSI